MNTRSIQAKKQDVTRFARKHHLAGRIRHVQTRVQTRVDRAFKGSSPEDIFVQATVATACVAVALRLIRSPGIGKVLRDWLPLAAFAGMYQRAMMKRAR